MAIIQGRDVLNGVILECNQAMCELSGVAIPDQLRGTSLRQILLDVTSSPSSGSSSEEEGEEAQIFDICFVGSDSMTRHCEATFKRFPYSPERIAVVIRDRTWKKNSESQVDLSLVVLPCSNLCAAGHPAHGASCARRHAKQTAEVGESTHISIGNANMQAVCRYSTR